MGEDSKIVLPSPLSNPVLEINKLYPSAAALELRNVTTMGIKHQGEYYIASFLNSIKGHQVYVKPSDNEEQIEVYDTKQYLGNAVHNPTRNTLKNICNTELINMVSTTSSIGSKKKFYTKCNEIFYKSSAASVTGYEYDSQNNKCKICPFAENISRTRNGIDVMIPECKAGEKAPNQINDYSTSNMDDFNNLSVHSIDWNWIEKVKEFSLILEGVEGTYYIQDLGDCRKCLCVAFKKNKKGIKSKNDIVINFF